MLLLRRRSFYLVWLDIAQRRDLARPQLLGHFFRHLLPALHRIRLGIVRIQPPVSDLDRVRVDLDAVVGLLECIVPPVPNVLAVGLAEADAVEA